MWSIYNCFLYSDLWTRYIWAISDPAVSPAPVNLRNDTVSSALILRAICSKSFRCKLASTLKRFSPIFLNKPPPVHAGLRERVPPTAAARAPQRAPRAANGRLRARPLRLQRLRPLAPPQPGRLPAAAADAPSLSPSAFAHRCAPAEEAPGGPPSLRPRFLFGERATPARGRWEAPRPRGRLSLPELSRFPCAGRGSPPAAPLRRRHMVLREEGEPPPGPRVYSSLDAQLRWGRAERHRADAAARFTAAGKRLRARRVPPADAPPCPTAGPAAAGGCGSSSSPLLSADCAWLQVRGSAPAPRRRDPCAEPAAPTPSRGGARRDPRRGAGIWGLPGSGSSARSASLGTMYRSRNCAWQDSN